MTKDDAPEEIVGKTIAGIALRDVESDADYEVLRIDFTDGYSIEIRSEDYEGYRSWLRFDK